MPNTRKVIALVFPPSQAAGQRIIEGILDRHLAVHRWTLIEVPKKLPGEDPFAGENLAVDGVITWAEARDVWLRNLVKRRIPVVNCGTEWVKTPGIASLHFDYEEIQSKVVEHFSALGLRRMVVIGHLLKMRPETQRILLSVTRHARKAGLDSCLWELDGKDSPGVTPKRLLAPDRETALAAFLTDLEKPAGLFTFGDHIGYIAATVASRLGIAVPRQIAICGMGGNMVASFANPPLTTIAGASRELGREAADCMSKWLATGKPPFQLRKIPGAEVIERESTVGGSGSVVLEAVRRHVESSGRIGTTLDHLVSLSGMSVKTLIRKYRDHFGVDPTEDMHKHRIAEAEKQLGQPALSISEVASACGFSSQSAFTNYFLRHRGITPGDFRRSIGQTAGKPR